MESKGVAGAGSAKYPPGIPAELAREMKGYLVLEFENNKEKVAYIRSVVAPALREAGKVGIPRLLRCPAPCCGCHRPLAMVISSLHMLSRGVSRFGVLDPCRPAV